MNKLTEIVKFKNIHPILIVALVIVIIEYIGIVWMFVISFTPPNEPPRSTLPVEPSLPDSSQTMQLYYIDAVLENMAEGRIAFNVPDSVMKLNESSTIQFLLDLTKTVEELESMFKESEVIESHRVRISETMEARLTGNGFRITAITPEQQPISTVETTEWKWEINAIEAGPQHLHLTLSAIIFFRDEKMARTIRTFDKKIFVEVSLGKRITGFINNNWQWLWTALLIPITGWYLKHRKKNTTESES